MSTTTQHGAATYLTALWAREDTAQLEAGETILIQGGAGGVVGFVMPSPGISALLAVLPSPIRRRVSRCWRRQPRRISRGLLFLTPRPLLWYGALPHYDGCPKAQPSALASDKVCSAADV